jgi:hypothetical protein
VLVFAGFSPAQPTDRQSLAGRAAPSTDALCPCFATRCVLVARGRKAFIQRRNKQKRKLKVGKLRRKWRQRLRPHVGNAGRQKNGGSSQPSTCLRGTGQLGVKSWAVPGANQGEEFPLQLGHGVVRHRIERHRCNARVPLACKSEPVTAWAHRPAQWPGCGNVNGGDHFGSNNGALVSLPNSAGNEPMARMPQPEPEKPEHEWPKEPEPSEWPEALRRRNDQRAGPSRSK